MRTGSGCLGAIGLVLCSVILTPSAAIADVIVELDADGIQGNGPDTVQVAPAEAVDIDVWLVDGDTLEFFHFYVITCNPNQGLEFQDATYHVPVGWDTESPVVDSMMCVATSAYAFNFTTIPDPSRVVTLVYQAGPEESVADLSVSDSSAYVAVTPHGMFELDEIHGWIGAVVEIVGTTGTEPSNWGMIKKLFR